MKKQVLFIIILIFNIIAINAGSEVYLKIKKAGTYRVKVAGQDQFNPNNTFRFYDVMSGNRKIEVIDTITKKVVNEVNIILKENHRTVLELELNGNFTIITEFVVHHSNWYTDQYNGGNNGWNGNNNGWNSDWNSNNGSWNGNNNGGWNGGNTWGSSTDATTFSSLKTYINGESFDSGKLSRAKEVTKTNPLSSSQIAEICKLFSYDSYRLDYAKYAYNYCTDKNNYYQLNNTFTYSSYANDLRDWVTQNGGTWNNGSWNGGWNGNNNGGWNGNNNGGWNGNNNGGWNGNNNGGWNGNNNGGWNGNNNNWNTNVDQTTFNNMIIYIKGESFDNGRLQRAKEVTNGNNLSSSQVADICKLFSFDDNRLEYAKYAYTRVTDRGSFFIVYNTFTFQSNVDKLKEYVNSF